MEEMGIETEKIIEFLKNKKNGRVKILGRTYRLIYTPVISQGEAKAGEIDHFKSTIKICSELTDDHKKIVLLHEALHAILMQLGFYEEHDNENLICSLSTSIYQLIKDNESLFASF